MSEASGTEANVSVIIPTYNRAEVLPPTASLLPAAARSQSSLRGPLKAGIEKAAVRSGLPRLLGYRRRFERLVLAYHNVVPDGEIAWGEGSLHITESLFRHHLDVLQRVATIVPLERFFRAEGHEPDGPFVAITFDDGYRGAVTVGAGELARRDLPATYFVTPGLSSEDGFWWDRMAQSEGGSLDEELREQCLQALAGQQARVLEWADSTGRARQVAPNFACPADHRELQTLTSRGHFQLGCHTWTHPNLRRLSSVERQQEFRRCRDWITEATGEPPEVLSYPYGLESPSVRADAAAAGHRHGFRISGGWLPRAGSGEELALPRLNIPAGLSPEGLRLRLAGLGLSS